MTFVNIRSKKQLLPFAITALVWGCYFMYIEFHLPMFSRQLIDDKDEKNEKEFVVKTSGCRIFKLKVYGPHVLPYVEEPDQIICNGGIPPLFDSNDTAIFMLQESLPSYSIKNFTTLRCYYRSFWRKIPNFNQEDTNIEYEANWTYFVNETLIKDEFVKVKCMNESKAVYNDYFSFVPDKTNKNEIEEEYSLGNENTGKREDLNVILIGMDSVSRLNLHRQLPKTAELLKVLSAVELLGYNKIEDSTFPNLIAVLTGLNVSDLKHQCWPRPMSRFDPCPFIWKQFKNKGFATVYAEDVAYLSTFHYLKNGFVNQPTDYWWNVYNREAEKQIGNNPHNDAKLCVGSRPIYLTLLEYIKKFTSSMQKQNKNYFGFFWEVSLSHDVLNQPKVSDKHYVDLFTTLEKNGILNNSAVIFLSDHGMRFGEFRKTYQGGMEEKLPFVFILLPKWYKEEFKAAYENLVMNTKILTTPFDLHETIKDLLNPYNLTEDYVMKQLDYAIVPSYSLFKIIPEKRTCDDAGIPTHWCTCLEYRDVSVLATVIKELAYFAVGHINGLLKKHSKCAYLILSKIMRARMLVPRNGLLLGQQMNTLNYMLIFVTTPGEAVFEASLELRFSNKSDQTFMVKNTISRLNLYGRQSSCVDDYVLKLYCYCTNTG